MYVWSPTNLSRLPINNKSDMHLISTRLDSYLNSIWKREPGQRGRGTGEDFSRVYQLLATPRPFHIHSHG